MGRHASHVMAKLTVRVPRGHQGFWDLIRERRRFTVRDLDRQSNVEVETVRDFVKRLAKGGYVEHVETADDGSYVYELRRDQADVPHLKRDGSPAADTGRGQDNMWRAIKMLGEFDVPTLAAHASTDSIRVTHLSAHSYVNSLRKAGYLIVLAQGKPGRPARYRLRPDRNTGPLAPQIQKTKYVFDPNLKQIMGEAQGGER